MRPEVLKILSYTKVVGDCYEYMLSHDARGYGRVFPNGVNKLVHRYMWELFYGEIPAGKVIMHTCDNPSCVRIEHLRCGTQRENMLDAKEKNRMAVGSKLPQAIITEDIVRQIVADLREGTMSQRQIAKKFCIHFSIISDIKLGKTWKSVTSNIQ